MESNQQFYSEGSFRTPRTAQYFQTEWSAQDYGWLLTHGYAMTAEQMIRKFEAFDLDNHYVLSLEALSRFYWQSHKDRYPVASWMTSRFRLSEIRDYCDYLESMMEKLEECQHKFLLGFSQGGTTLWRFINAVQPDFDCFINWSGDIPLDTEYDLQYLKDKKLVYFMANKDKYYSAERQSGLIQRAQELGLNIEFVKFEGEHKLYPDVLKTWWTDHYNS